VIDPRKTRRLGSVDVEAPPSLVPPIAVSDYPPPDEHADDDAVAEVSVEVVVIPEKPRPHNPRWRAFEVWTRNRVYGLDANLVCFVTLDRKSKQIDKNPSIKGFKLGGGRSRVGNSTKIAYPFPVIGMEAMFTDGKRRIHTSKTERFVIRIRELSLRVEDDTTSWEDLASG
jgi:hypothetical protein